MPPEFWLAVASAILTGGGVLIVVLIKYTFKRNGNSKIPTTANLDYIEENDCGRRMEEQEKLFNGKIELVNNKIDTVVKVGETHTGQFEKINDTLIDILKAVKIA